MRSIITDNASFISLDNSNVFNSFFWMHICDCCSSLLLTV